MSIIWILLYKYYYCMNIAALILDHEIIEILKGLGWKAPLKIILSNFPAMDRDIFH